MDITAEKQGLPIEINVPGTILSIQNAKELTSQG